jgi:hypothetical protein
MTESKKTERLKAAAVALFNLKYKWPRPAAEQLAAAQRELDEAQAAVDKKP